MKTSSGRRVKKRYLVARDGTIPKTSRTKKSKSGRKASKRKSSKGKTLRPQRTAARNARSIMSRITGTSTDGDDEVDSEGDSSNSESFSQDSSTQNSETERHLENVKLKSIKKEQESEGIVWSHELPKTQSDTLNRKRLVLKFSLRDSRKPAASEATRLNTGNQINVPDPSSGPSGAFDENKNDCTKDPGLTTADVELSEHDRIDLEDTRQSLNTEDHLEKFLGEKDNKIRWGEVKIRTSKRSRSGDLVPSDVPNGNRITAVNRYVKYRMNWNFYS